MPRQEGSPDKGILDRAVAVSLMASMGNVAAALATLDAIDSVRPAVTTPKKV
jgi:hypothetical protein